MKTKKIISIKNLDTKVAQLFVSYCFLIKNKLSEDWFFTNKEMPEIVAIPASFNGEISKDTKIVIRIGSKNKRKQDINSEGFKLIDISSPFNSNQIITELNNISIASLTIAKQDVRKKVFSFKKVISKLFLKHTQSTRKISSIKTNSMNKNSKTNALLKLVDPNYHNNLKVVFLGRPGAGKTTAIVSAQSEGLVSCEVNATDTIGMLKHQTTIGIDYCQCNFKNGIKLKLFGTPGQGRYSQLQTQTVKNADICIILIDLTSVAPFSEFKYYQSILDSVNNRDSLKVVLFTHCDQNEHDIGNLSKDVKRAAKGDVITARIDPRNRNEVRDFLKLISKEKLKNNANINLQSFSI